MQLVIIGNGVAGITCAMEVRRRDAKARITVVSGETDYFFSRTALMYAFMDRLNRRDLEPYERSEFTRQRIDLVRGWVTDVDTHARQVVVGNRRLPFDHLVYAVGAKANRFNWEGLDRVEDGLVNFVSMQDLDTCERLTPSTQKAVVVGGGLIGIELVECLRHHGVDVTFLVREPHYWPVALGREESELVTTHMREHGVDVRLSDELARIETDEAGRVSGIITKKGESLPCQMLGITAGVRPNIDALRAFSNPPELGRGIVTDQYLQTTQPGVWACGDCAEIQRPGRPPLIELIWYSAKRQGLLAAANILGDHRPYEPPVFFNSSKFFEIEFTTVGDVMKVPAGTPSIVLRHVEKPMALRIVHKDGAVIGFNALGSRWNHEVFTEWVSHRLAPEEVVRRLPQAQFDVEFGRAPLAELVRSDLPVQPPVPA